MSLKYNFKPFSDFGSCESPIFLNGRGYVPCGHCFACALKKKKEWMTRCSLELEEHFVSSFLTLTFDEEHLHFATYDTVQKFFKRLRKSGIQFKYFGCFELGGKTKRPHFHAIMFGWYPQPIIRHHKVVKTSNEWVRDRFWPFGNVSFKPVKQKTIPYICSYVQKKMIDLVSSRPFDVTRREHTRSLKYNFFYPYKESYIFASKGLGMSKFAREHDDMCKKGFFVLNGYKKPLCKCFRDYILYRSDPFRYDNFEDFILSWTYLKDKQLEYEGSSECPNWLLAFWRSCGYKEYDTLEDCYFDFVDKKLYDNRNRMLRIRRKAKEWS